MTMTMMPIAILSIIQDDLFKLLPTLAILKLLGILLFVGHLFGCFFFFFSTEDFNSSLEDAADSNSWVVKEFGEDYEDKPLFNKYIASMYVWLLLFLPPPLSLPSFHLTSFNIPLPSLLSLCV